MQIVHLVTCGNFGSRGQLPWSYMPKREEVCTHSVILLRSRRTLVVMLFLWSRCLIFYLVFGFVFHFLIQFWTRRSVTVLTVSSSDVPLLATPEYRSSIAVSLTTSFGRPQPWTMKISWYAVCCLSHRMRESNIKQLSMIGDLNLREILVW